MLPCILGEANGSSERLGLGLRSWLEQVVWCVLGNMKFCRLLALDSVTLPPVELSMTARQAHICAVEMKQWDKILVVVIKAQHFVERSSAIFTTVDGVAVRACVYIF